MWVKYTDAGLIQDLNFTLTINSKCNLSCKYCPFINQNTEISEKVLDEYVSFFRTNEEELKKLTENIVFVFFGWEPLLSFEKIKYFMEAMYDFWITTKFVIYTNGVLLTQKMVDYLESFPDYKTRVIFYFSIDWWLERMMKYRLKKEEEFVRIKDNLLLLKERWFTFSLSKVISEDNGNDLFESFKFLHSFSPEKLDCLPLSFYQKGWYERAQIVQIIKWYELFINYLLSEGYSERNILEYLWLPDDFAHLKKIYKADYGLYWYMDGNMYPLCDSLPIFSLGKTFSSEEKEKLNLWNINQHEKILAIIKNFKKFEEDFYDFWRTWHDREFPNEIHAFGIIIMYFVKRLFIYKNKPVNRYGWKN